MSNQVKLLVAGVVLTCIVYLVPLYFGQIWLGLFLALLTITFFLARLVRFSNSRISSKKTQKIIFGIVGLLVLFHAIAFATDYNKRGFQKDILLEIRKSIDESIVKTEVQNELIYVLGQFHSGEYESVIEASRNIIGRKLGSDGVYLSNNDLENLERDNAVDDDTNYFYLIDEAEDQLQVIVVCDISLGEEPEFKNYDGQTGQFEMRFTLTKFGVRYEVRN